MPGRVVDCAAAVTTEESEELAETSPVMAEATAFRALCSELKFDCWVLRSDCWLCKVLTSLSNCSMGSSAMDTARCKTCWKELEKVLWPLNVTGFVTELAVLLVLLISNCLCKIGAEPLRVRPNINQGE